MTMGYAAGHREQPAQQPSAERRRTLRIWPGGMTFLVRGRHYPVVDFSPRGICLNARFAAGTVVCGELTLGEQSVAVVFCVLRSQGLLSGGSLETAQGARLDGWWRRIAPASGC